MNKHHLYRISSKRHYDFVINDAKMIAKKACMLTKNIAVSVSGGKDSVVMAHIVSQYCDPLIIWNNSGLELPESKDIVYKLAKQLGLKYAIAKGFAFERKLKIGKEASIRESAKTDNLCIRRPIMDIHKAYGIELEFVGLRIKESKKRKILILTHGPIYFNKKWNCYSAWPMRYWHALDCLAYIDQYNLPLHPAYLRTEWEKQENIRVSWVWDSNRENKGDFEYMRKYYPKIWQKICKNGFKP